MKPGPKPGVRKTAPRLTIQKHGQQLIVRQASNWLYLEIGSTREGEDGFDFSRKFLESIKAKKVRVIQ
jgi:hypothetical protein